MEVLTPPAQPVIFSGTVGEDPRSLVDARVARIQQASDFPALSRQIIDTISAIDDDASSLQRLANVVLREYSLTLGVVRTANTAHYRRTGRPIQSATHAMMLLGARTVRNLAGSLLLFDNYSKRSPVLKELMILSLISANQAREVAVKLQRGNPEEAHLCAMFRNLGEVLIACHFPDDYASIQLQVHERGLSVQAAAHAVLGFHYEELAGVVARLWGMPDAVVHGLKARPGAVTSDVGAITAFSHELTRTIYRRNPDADPATESLVAERAVDELLQRHSAHLRLSRDQVRDIVEAAFDEARELFTTARVPMESKQLKKLSNAAKLALGLSETPTNEFEIALIDTSDAPGTPELRSRLFQELEGKVSSHSGAELGAVLLLALEAALRGGPFDRVIACVVNGDRSRLVARSGLGEGVEQLMARFDFPMHVRGGPVAAALMHRMPLYVPTDRSPTLSEGRWMRQQGVAQFGVFPIIVSGTIVGCLYCDRAQPTPVADRTLTEFMQSLSGSVVKAIKARRGVRPAITPAGIPAETPASSTTAVQFAVSGEQQELSAQIKCALVLRVLQGEAVAHVADSAGVAEAQLVAWRQTFLEGAITRLGTDG